MEILKLLSLRKFREKGGDLIRIGEEKRRFERWIRTDKGKGSRADRTRYAD